MYMYMYIDFAFVLFIVIVYVVYCVHNYPFCLSFLSSPFFPLFFFFDFLSPLLPPLPLSCRYYPQKWVYLSFILNVHVATCRQHSVLYSCLFYFPLPSPPSLPPSLPPLPFSLSLQVESKQLVHGRIFDIASQRGRGGTYLRLLVNFNEDTISLYKEVGGKTCIFSCIFNDLH